MISNTHITFLVVWHFFEAANNKLLLDTMCTV